MNILFDMQLINRNRLRSFRQKDFSVYFLLDRVAKEIAFRLNMINQTFENALELHGITGIVGYTSIVLRPRLSLLRTYRFSTIELISPISPSQ
ncbi:hypothetical protein [Candidatus Liberibacter asiaticus]|uniref:hypothetical protein n=1 Tax=Liberibacter asiaticus TaxID=34021 RepID=UPI0013F84484|nr:hypothetical protein [Candidatus Liberibacter asiaticus]KAE9513727.1 hypothetical protein FXW35_00990 [Candidatus Liberibacter asiaticus]